MRLPPGNTPPPRATAGGGHVLRDAFATKEVRKVLRPIMGMERFNAGPRSAIDYSPTP